MAIRATRENLGCSIPAEAKKLGVVCVTTRWLGSPLEHVKRRLLIPHVPHLELAVQGTRYEDILGSWVYLDLRDESVVTLVRLCLLYLGLTQVIESY